MQETQARPLGQEDPLEKGMAIYSVFLPEKSHGQRSLVGYSPWGHKSQTRLSDKTILIICLSIRAQDIVLLNIFNNNPTLLKGLL